MSNGYSPIFFDSPLFYKENKQEIKPGFYNRVCKIPKNFLFSGIFNVSIWAGTNSYDEVVLKDCLTFKVKIQDNITVKSLGHVNHPILPKLLWSLEDASKSNFDKKV